MAFWDKFKKKRHTGSAAPKARAVSVGQEGERKSEEATFKPLNKDEKRDTKLAYRVLIAPLQSEKAARLGSENKYVFEVAAGANKIEIKEAVFRVYGIRPTKVNIVRLPRKKVRYGRVEGTGGSRIKAVVTLPPGKTISIYEGV